MTSSFSTFITMMVISTVISWGISHYFHLKWKRIRAAGALRLSKEAMKAYDLSEKFHFMALFYGFIGLITWLYT